MHINRVYLVLAVVLCVSYSLTGAAAPPDTGANADAQLEYNTGDLGGALGEAEDAPVYDGDAGGDARGTPPNDACADAIVITTGPVAGDTTPATEDGTAIMGDCATAETAPDLWYSFTPNTDCLLEVTTCGGAGWDTLLSIHSGCPGTPDNELVCNDDSCAQRSTVLLDAFENETYLIRVAGWRGAVGPFTMQVSCLAPPPDNCQDTMPIGDGIHTGSTATATNDGAATCGNSSTSPDVWYRYDPLEDCLLRASTCDATFDTVLSIHADCPGTGLNEMVCDNDGCGIGSFVEAEVIAGGSYYIRVAGFEGAAGPFDLTIACVIPGQDGADGMIGEMHYLQQFGRLGDVVGCAMDATLCNAGTEPLDWYGNPDPRHPFEAFNMYRLKDDRLEQIGQSWVKHGFAASQNDACGLGCTPHSDGTRLGIGCADTYSVSLNAGQHLAGPRSEINPWTGVYVYEGSHLQTQPGGHDAVEHRLQLHDDDLDPALNVGANYFAELYIVTHDDIYHMNNVAFEPAVVTGAPGGTWSFDIGGSNTQIGPALNAWPGSVRTVIPPDPIDDGRCILAAKVTDNGDGTWHYEYALYNHDLDRKVGSFSVPVLSSTTVTGVGFYAPDSAGEAYHNDVWAAVRGPGDLSWSTEPYDVNPTANPLRWGTLYNFYFDADAAPVDSTATLGIYEPGTPSELEGPVVAPSPGGAASPVAESAGPCVTDVECVDGAVCVAGACYVPKNRYVSMDPSGANAGVLTARRVGLDLNGDEVFDVAVDAMLGWVGAPAEVTVAGPEVSPQLQSRIDSAAHYRDWSVNDGGVPWTDATVHLGDCEVSNGQTYLIQAIANGQDALNEANYSPPLALRTVVDFGDVIGSTGGMPPDAVRNFKDISAVVRGFQSIQTEPKVWLDLQGATATPEVPDFGDINFSDINWAVGGFQGAVYPFAAPCDCPGQACP